MIINHLHHQLKLKIVQKSIEKKFFKKKDSPFQSSAFFKQRAR
jgi:hypothetical protein